ncbi:FtsX-like permease family protein [Hydrogenovibrio sp. 3SP14C1]|uniref:ABC transporter permease n=1 Tax=Hydrogenovibrio sp. 3SP14C1 TaxID=3038774 RepID=UPI00241779EC|nr:FtsX-like permease family protein [Hydrogenovibrio sp. 3SP14C1]MDG4811789.1 FtsX-like permease family protein [Hydrogenovibrio sp. 3SP14C1]
MKKTYFLELLTASKWFLRGIKRGDWVWLLLAVMIASATVTFVEKLGQTVKQSMVRQAANNLGADYVIRSSRPIDAKWQQKAQQLGLETAQAQSLITMALSNDQFQLVQLRAVSPNTPLRSQTQNYPKVSGGKQVWAEQNLVSMMGLSKDSQITLGKQTFSLAGSFQPVSSGIGMGAFAYQMVIPLSQLETTDLKGPGSRVGYELSVAGNPAAIKNFARQVEQAENPHLQTLSAQAPSQDLAKSLDTAWLFLELAALSAVMVAGLSILIASRFYLQRWQSSIALMRAFGAQRAQMSRLFAFQLSWLAVLGSGVGVLLGAGLFQLVIPVLQTYFQSLVVADSGWIYLHGFLMGFLVLWGFAWQAFRSAVQTSPLQLLKSVDSTPKMKQWLISLGLVLIVVISMTGYVFWVLLGLLMTGTVLYLAAIGLLKLVQALQSQSKGWFKLSLAALSKEPGLVKIQLVSIGLVLFVLMLMTFVRQDLMYNWQTSLPKNTPDTFLVNVQPDQKQTVIELLNSHQINAPLVPMARGRLVAVNDTPVKAKDQTSDRARRLLERESNIAVLSTLPSYNELVQQSQAESLTSEQKALLTVSVEEGMAELFGIQLNDVLTFSFTGQEKQYRVDSIRRVQWQSFRLNFFFIVQPGEQPSLPISYISNFTLSNKTISASQLTQQLAQQAPGVLLIDAKRILSQVQTIMSQASWAVTALYGFTLLASLIVLFTATMASQQTRVQSWLLLRTIGATQKEIIKIGLMEFVLLGALAGLLAAIFAQLASWGIGYFVLEIPFSFNPVLWVTSMLTGIFILLMIGWLTQKRYLRQSPRRMAQKWS